MLLMLDQAILQRLTEIVHILDLLAHLLGGHLLEQLLQIDHIVQGVVKIGFHFWKVRVDQGVLFVAHLAGHQSSEQRHCVQEAEHLAVQATLQAVRVHLVDQEASIEIGVVRNQDDVVRFRFVQELTEMQEHLHQRPMLNRILAVVQLVVLVGDVVNSR